MIERVVVRKGSYHDSAFLMRVARELEGTPGVTNAVVLMGTPMNRELLEQAGFAANALGDATAVDLVVALRAVDEATLATAERALARFLDPGGAPDGAGDGVAAGRPAGARDLAEALARHPEARLVAVSVPGPYAAFVAHRSLSEGRHVFLFSNNVPLEDELALKRRARELGLLVMGPDCGTAIVAGVGLGFANRVPRGRIGIVGASGTGIQEVSCLLAAAGEGVSQAIGTGSRDLSAEVGGAITEMGLRWLAADPATKVLVVVAKHPAEAVAARMHGVLSSLGKPAVVRYLGKPARPAADGVVYAATIDEAAAVAAALARGAPSDAAAADLRAECARDVRDAGLPKASAGRLVGLYGGGSLAAEARLNLAALGVETEEPDHPIPPEGPLAEPGNLIVDTGEDFYTVGRPHPMVDQRTRTALIRKVGADPSVGVLTFDLVLGDGSHADPAPELAAAIRDARAARAARGAGPLVVIGSVCGADADPQDPRRQRAVLEEAGALVLPSAARAAICAALILKEHP